MIWPPEVIQAMREGLKDPNTRYVVMSGGEEQVSQYGMLTGLIRIKRYIFKNNPFGGVAFVRLPDVFRAIVPADASRSIH